MATIPERFRLRTEPVNEKRFVALFLAAGFVHVVLDGVTTMLAYYYGDGYELNPLLRPHLQAGPVQFLVAYSPIVVITVAGGVGLIYYLRKADSPWDYRLSLLGQVIFAIAFVWGLLVSVTNLFIFV